MAKRSAGVLLYRQTHQRVEVLLGHIGGPFWRNKDAGAWSIPKGLIEAEESAAAAARREFREETGLELDEPLEPLTPVRQKSGKEVVAFAVARDVDPEQLISNTYRMEWPPRSGRQADFPEIDRFAWWSIEQALEKVVKGQQPILKELRQRLLK